MARWRTRKSGIKKTFRKRKTFRKNKRYRGGSRKRRVNKRFSKRVKSTYKRKKRTMNKLYGGMKHKKKIWKPPKLIRCQGFRNLLGGASHNLPPKPATSQDRPSLIVPESLLRQQKKYAAKILKDEMTEEEMNAKYQQDKKLGTGGFSTVFNVKMVNTGEDKFVKKIDTDFDMNIEKEFAMKKIDKSKLDSTDIEALNNEISILKEVRHQYIVRAIEYYETEHEMFIVMEKMSGGELYHSIIQKNKYTEEEAIEVVKRIAEALKFLHGKNIVHCDIKPENILLENTEDNTSVKLADFGFAKKMNHRGQLNAYQGTPNYLAPEMASGVLDGDFPPYNEKVDCWALGVVFYILLYGFPPFYNKNYLDLLTLIKTMNWDFPSPEWDEVSYEVKDLVHKLMEKDPNERLSAAKILEHPWIQDAETMAREKIANYVEMLKDEKSDEKVKNIAAITLEKLANVSETNRQIIVESSGIEALADIFTDTSSSELKGNARKALFGFENLDNLLLISNIDDKNEKIDDIMEEPGYMSNLSQHKIQEQS